MNKTHVKSRPGGPKIGVALSGGSGRAIAHIGVLEVLEEEGISLDFITACSSGALIAASYACGTMEQLKQDWMQLNKKFILNLIDIDRSGKSLFKTEGLADWFSKYTLNKNFEDLASPRLGFVCADITSGSPVTLTLGPIMRAGQASCAVPGLFEPVEWGNKLLIDGGLFSIVPTAEAKQMGADIVIGVDIAATRYLFSKKILRMRKIYNFFKKSLPVRIYLKVFRILDWLFSKSINLIYYNQSDIYEDEGLPKPRLLGIWGRAVDISIAQSEGKKEFLGNCDCVIMPDVKHLGKMDFENAREMLEEGRRAARRAIPEIRKIIQDYQWRREILNGKINHV